MFVCWESVDALEKKQKKQKLRGVVSGEVWWKEQPWRQHVGSKKKKKEKKNNNNNNNELAVLNYFLLFLNDHVSNFCLPCKRFLTELTPGVKLITA